MNDFDKKAAEAADLRLDAENGRELWRTIAAQHRREGGALASDGIDFDSPLLWSPLHKDGWLEYMRLLDLAADEAQYTPRPVVDF